MTKWEGNRVLSTSANLKYLFYLSSKSQIPLCLPVDEVLPGRSEERSLARVNSWNGIRCRLDRRCNFHLSRPLSNVWSQPSVTHESDTFINAGKHYYTVHAYNLR